MKVVGVSWFGDQEFAEIIRERTEVPGTGLVVSSLRFAAHRQLIGSIVVLGLISAASSAD